MHSQALWPTFEWLIFETAKGFTPTTSGWEPWGLMLDGWPLRLSRDEGEHPASKARRNRAQGPRHFRQYG